MPFTSDPPGSKKPTVQKKAAALPPNPPAASHVAKAIQRQVAPNAPRPLAAHLASAVQPKAIQRAQGGKAGLSYGSLEQAYSREEIEQAMKDVGIKGIKGHKKGQQGSGISGQTKNETERVVEALRTNKAKPQERKCSNCDAAVASMTKKCKECGQMP